MSEETTSLTPDTEKTSNVSRGGIAFTFVLLFLIAIAAVVLGAISLVKLTDNESVTTNMGNTVNTLSSNVSSIQSTLNKIDAVFTDNYQTATLTTLKFGPHWGITHAAGELQFFGVNDSVTPNVYPCTFMFFKNNGVGQPKSFYLVGTDQPGALGGTSINTCKAPGTFD